MKRLGDWGMTIELADLVDSEGNVLPNVKEKIIKELCEFSAGGSWFYSLTMPMVSCALLSWLILFTMAILV